MRQEEISALGLLAKKDNLIDGLTLELGNHSTEDLRAIAEDSERINPDGWMHRMIYEYLEMWR